ncbi:MAG: PAS domain S-box protein [Desulfarculus sp.]|nr:PAS domain S-box protein [Desulfarculus sp.]
MQNDSLVALHIEDEASVANLLRAILEEEFAPLELRWASTLQEGLKSVDNDLQVIILDLMLPDSAGLHTLEQVLHRASWIPIVVVSGEQDEELAKEAIKIGAQDYLTKNVLKPSVVSRVLRYAMERKANENALLEAREKLEERVVQRTHQLMELNDKLMQEASSRRKSEERYRNLVETIPEGIWLLDAEGAFTYCNNRFLTMLGYELSEILGEKVFDFADSKYQAILHAQRERRRHGAEDAYELALTTKGGQQLFLMVHPKAMFADNGEYQGALALVVDITQRKLLEAQLLQAQKLESIGHLAAGIAHEINTPTQYVMDNTKFFQQSITEIIQLLGTHAKLLAEARQQDCCSEIIAELEEQQADIDLDFLVEELPVSIEQTLEGLSRIADIVRAMKEFSHPGSSEKAPLDLNKALENTIIVAKNEWKYVAEVETALAPDLPAVPCLAGEIKQVFLNIIVNAAQAIGQTAKEGSQAKGKIGISTRAVSDRVEVRISDNGPGIPEAIVSRIFDPFFTTKEPGKGTGQGLAIAYGVVVDKHKGELLVNSQEGQGTTFIIRLPLHG